MKETRSSVDDALVSSLLTASRVLVAISVQSLGAVEDTVTLPQFRALVVLRSQGAQRLTELAARLGVAPSSAQRLVDRLVAAGQVTRQENEVDRRAVDIALTPQGRRLVDQVTDTRREAIARVVAAMPTSRRRGLVAALTAFADAADEPAAGAVDGW